MALSLTPEEMSMLAALHRSPFGGSLQALLRRKVAHNDEKCRTLDGPALYRAQGASQELVQLLDEIGEAQRKEEARRRPVVAPPMGRM